MIGKTVVIFIDLDATVMINPFWSAVFPQLGLEFEKGIGIPSQDIIKEFISENVERLNNPPDNQVLTMDWDDIVKTVAHKHGYRLTLSVESLVNTHAFSPYSYLLENSDKVLNLLAREKRILVASSMGLSKYQFPVLKSLGIFKAFDDFLMPDITGYIKTDRRFYEKYLQKSNEYTFISVGDHYKDDIFCPKSFGFYTILKANIHELEIIPPFERKIHLHKYQDKIRGALNQITILPDAVIIDLSELPSIVNGIENM